LLLEPFSRFSALFFDVLNQRPRLMIHAGVRPVQQADKLAVRLCDAGSRNRFELSANHPDPFLDVLGDLQGGFLGDNIGHVPVRRGPQEKKGIVQVSGRSFAEGIEKDCSIGPCGRRRDMSSKQ